MRVLRCATALLDMVHCCLHCVTCMHYITCNGMVVLTCVQLFVGDGLYSSVLEPTLPRSCHTSKGRGGEGGDEREGEERGDERS